VAGIFHAVQSELVAHVDDVVVLAVGDLFLDQAALGTHLVFGPVKANLRRKKRKR
jgi:hypothetical protein